MACTTANGIQTMMNVGRPARQAAPPKRNEQVSIMHSRRRRGVAAATAAAAILMWTGHSANAACTGGPDVFTCVSEADYLAKIGQLGYGTFTEGFEDDAVWGTVRSSLTVTNSAPSITSQGITWTANHVQNEITTGAARRTGQWGLYDPDHGFATGTALQCDIDNPPEHCLWHDGFTGTRVAGEGMLHAAGGYIKTSTVGANVVMVIDDVNQIGFGKLTDTDYHFFGVIDTRGFTRFQFMEIDGKIGQKLVIFGDDFTFAQFVVIVNDNLDPAAINNQTYDATPVPEGPAGMFSFIAQFCAKSSSPDIKAMYSRTERLDHSNSLITRDRDGAGVPPGGVGSELDFPPTLDYADMILAPNDCVEVTYEIGLTQRRRFSFYVDVYGVVPAVTP
jgi:hypothetical protein